MDEWYEVYIDRLLVQFERKLTGQRKGLKKNPNTVSVPSQRLSSLERE